MSEVKRWGINPKDCSMDEFVDGSFVLHTDYAALEAKNDELCKAIKLASDVGIKVADEVIRLKAEVERLRASSFVTAVPVEEYEKLKSENKRLRNAGDALFEFAKTANTLAHKELRKVLKAWNAAKEGKQP